MSQVKQKLQRWQVIPVAMLLIGVGCSRQSDDEDGGRDDAPEAVSKLIGDQGGQIEARGLELAVPAGALDSEVEISVEKTGQATPEGIESASAVYRFRPDGLEFNKPVEVTVSVQNEPDDGLVALYWSKSGSESGDDASEYRPLPTTVESGQASATIEHFSRGFAGRPPPCTGGGCPGGIPCVGGYCYVPDCDDGRQNGFETDIDCGGVDCGGCAIGKSCDVDADCTNDRCVNGECTQAPPPDTGLPGDTGGDAGDTGGDGGDTTDPPTMAPAVNWTRLVDTPRSEESVGVDTDSAGNIYVAGRTRGKLGGTPITTIVWPTWQNSTREGTASG